MVATEATVASMTSLPQGYRAAVIGATGAIGAAVAKALAADPRAGEVLRFGRSGRNGATPLDVLDEARLADCAAGAGPLQLIFIAVGGLHVEVPGEGERRAPEKSLGQLDGAGLAAAYAVNAIGPALALKHFHRALPRDGRSLVAALSARVGSIGDNRLGGWYGYRASKAALNQVIRTAAIEVARRCPQAVLAALHPGTVESDLSRPFRPSGAGSDGVFAPDAAAAKLLGALNGLTPSDSGSFRDFAGRGIEW